MNLIAICVLCVITSLICRLLARDSGEISSALSLCAVTVIGITIMLSVSDIVTLSQRLYERSQADGEYFSVMIKGAGICILTKTAADCCRDCGESSLASSAETAGRIALLMTAFPLFGGVIGIVEELLL